MGATTSILTFEEFEQLPDEVGKTELLDGELSLLPPPKTIHMRIAYRLHAALVPWANQVVGLGETDLEMGYKLASNTWLVPDVSIEHPNQLQGDYLEGSPLLAVEIVSDANSAEQLERKVKHYLTNGGLEVWLFYPKTRTVWVYRHDEAHSFRGKLQSQLFPGMEMDLEAIFG